MMYRENFHPIIGASAAQRRAGATDGGVKAARCLINPISEGKEDGGMREGEKKQGITTDCKQETRRSCAGKWTPSGGALVELSQKPGSAQQKALA